MRGNRHAQALLDRSEYGLVHRLRVARGVDPYAAARVGGGDLPVVRSIGTAPEQTRINNGGSAPGTVLGVLRPGYGKGSQQLRPASVVVSGREE